MTGDSATQTATKTVLIADDNRQILELLEAYLDTLGVSVITAADGKAALDAIQSRRPDLVLLDVMMPKLSGFEVCRAMKGDDALSAIPVIMVTALNEVGDVDRAKEFGADEFLSKPVNKHDLLDRVRKHLAL
ncbi:MAG: response regulator [Phycisphaerae bacterium]